MKSAAFANPAGEEESQRQTAGASRDSEIWAILQGWGGEGYCCCRCQGTNKLECNQENGKTKVQSTVAQQRRSANGLRQTEALGSFSN